MAVLGSLPLTGGAAPRDGATSLQQGVSDLVGTVDQTVKQVLEPVTAAVDETVRQLPARPAAPAPARPAPEPSQSAVRAPAAERAPAQDPATEPPMHGDNQHGQGSVAVVDLQPSAERPLGGDPTGADSDEEVVVGRSRGEQRPDGTYHGHITIAALFGNEILGVDTGPGQTAAGPLDALQTSVLDAICNGSGNNLCVSAVRADSQTTDNGSTNRFSTANATIGGPGGIAVGAAESTGTASSDGQCQTTRGSSSVANVNAGGQAVAGVARSSTESRACKGQAPQQTNDSRVLELGGTAVPLPAAGCGTGAPDTVTGIPTLAPIVCNADETNSGQAPAPSGVREALSIFALATGTSSLVKTTAAASESHAKAPPAQCTDGQDNDGDGVVDAADPGCHTDGNPNNPGSYDPNDDSEAGGGTGAGGNPTTGAGTPGGGGGGGEGDGGDDGERRGGPQCSDGRDNDGDGRIDAADPGCHTDGDASNPDSYDPSDTSEGGDGGPGDVRGDRDEGSLAMTGTGVLGLALGGLVLMAAGLGLRRRPMRAR